MKKKQGLELPKPSGTDLSIGIGPPIVLRDTREKPGYGFNFIKCETCGGTEEVALDFGDYTLKDYPNLIVIERKQDVGELCSNLGANRLRFERELQKFIDANVKYRYVIIGDYYSSIFRQKYSKMHPNAIFESIVSLEIKYGIHFVFAGTHENAHRLTRSLLLKAHKYRVEGVI